MRSRLLLPMLLVLPVLSVLLAFSSPAPCLAADETPDPLANLEWRNIGPINMSGRVADVEGIPGDPRILYVGSASGGVWKTTDGGLTFAPIFDQQPVQSIGDLALAPSQPDVVYVGTGEGNPRNSVSVGNGMYRSNDGGDTWHHLGLEDSRHITRVIVHPTDPNTVWVAALGHIFGPNEQRGVFRTRDGGKTWQKVLYIDEHHGAADLNIDPKNPNVLFAGMWLFERKPWTHTSGSEEGGVFRSLDGGDTWEKLSEGLPSMLGRIGVKVAPSAPETVYVIAESNDGTLFRSDDRGKTFRKVYDEVNIVSRGLYYTDLRVDPVQPDRVFAISSRLFRSIDGGRTFDRISQSTHVDYHSLWIDPQDPQRIWQGQDGGVAVSYDGGERWEPVRNLPLAQFYQIFHDDRQPFYFLGGGLQDNGAWYGPSRTREPAGILSDDWRMMSFGDAYFIVAHAEQEDYFLSESQGGGIVRTDMSNRRQTDVSPQPKRNDGGPVGELDVRFSWNAPIIASPHDPNKVYFAGNVVFETTDFGDTWRQISDDLTTDDEAKQGEAGGPIWFENTTAEYHCTIISFAESPAQAGVLWAGSDDGKLHLSKDGGGSWSDLTAALGQAEFAPISHVEPARGSASTAYVALDRHMFDDLRPHIFRTTDFGATWQRRTEGLPANAWVWVVREDPRNPDLLYAGTEMGLFASHDAGKNWQELDLANLPSVAVHDILVHPRRNDLILGTHGRAIYVLDDATPIQRLDDIAQDAAAHLFAPMPGIRFASFFTRYGLGDKVMASANPPYGVWLNYYLADSHESEANASKDAAKDHESTGDEGESEEPDEAPGNGQTDENAESGVSLEILDAEGSVVRTLKDFPLGPGVQRVAWDLRMDAPRTRRDGARAGGGGFRGPPQGPQVLPGNYMVRLTVDGAVQQQPLQVTVDPSLSVEREGLQQQFDTALALRDMRSEVNDILRGMDAIEVQLKERRQSQKLLRRDIDPALDESWKAFAEQLESLKHQLIKPEGKTFWSQGQRLNNHLGSLFGNIERGFAGPTVAQLALFEDLQGELQRLQQEWQALLSEDAVALNTALETHQVPSLALPAVALPNATGEGETGD